MWTALVILLLPTSTAVAQTATGDIQGVIVDASGVALSGVTVTITNTATHATREVITSDEGLFAAPGLAVGPYEVQASLQGYATRRQPEVRLHVGQVITLRLELTAAPAPETITIAEIAPVVERTQPDRTVVVNSVDLDNLPSRTRNVFELARLAPGHRDVWSRAFVDAVDSELFRNDFLVPQTAVEEFTVSTGTINAVTKAGANEVRGSAFEFYGNSRLNTNSAINEREDLPKGRYRNNQFGGSVGGPLVENTHFGYVSYEGHRTTDTNSVFLNLPPDTPADSATRAAINRLTQLAAPWERTQRRNTFVARTDHQLTGSQRVTVRYLHHDFSGRGVGASGPQIAFDSSGDSTVTARELGATSHSVIGSGIVNEARVLVARGTERIDPRSTAPQMTINQSGTEVFRIGTDPLLSQAARVRRIQFADTAMWVRGSHSMKGGFDFQFDDVLARAPGDFAGAYTFNSLASFTRGVPNGPGDAFTRSFEGPGTSGREVRPDTRQYALFAEDEWRLSQAVALNVGLRYDVETFGASTVKTDTNNLGPRAGIAWAPVNKRYVVRGDYGVVYGRTPWTMLASALANNGMNVRTVTTTGGVSHSTTVAFDPDYRNARIQQASTGFEWEWMPHTSVAGTYLFVDGSNLPRAIDLTNGDHVIAFQSTAASRYNAITLELNRRFSQGQQYHVAYTLGKITDTAPFGSKPVDVNTDRAPADDDRRHRLVASIVYSTNPLAERFEGAYRSLLSDWTLSAIYTAESGLPYSAYANNDLNGDQNRFNDLAPGTARNQYHMLASMSLDPRIARDVKVKGGRRVAIIWEAFNVLNRPNYNVVNDIMYNVVGTQLRANPLFRQFIGQTEPRMMQLAVRVSFR